MVALTNQFAGSDGDIFSHCFKLYGLGPLVGMRTWGGVVGINPYHELVDGTMTTQPEYSFWFIDAGWGVENYGTDPDVEVDIAPQDAAAGLDPQMETALRLIAESLGQSAGNCPTSAPIPTAASRAFRASRDARPRGVGRGPGTLIQMDASADDLEVAGRRLVALRGRRARSRRAVRALLDAMEAEAQRRLSTIFNDDDPVTGRPVCLLVKSDDLLDEEYERQTPRPIPDSLNRLTIEVLGRTLAIAVDDFGRVRIDGVDGVHDLRRIARSEAGVAFSADVSPHEEPRQIPFAALLAQLIEDVVEEEAVALPGRDEAPDHIPTVRGEADRNVGVPTGV